jgi:alkylation response protein AidB-like acyl-CoA dehydrogenase
MQRSPQYPASEVPAPCGVAALLRTFDGAEESRESALQALIDSGLDQLPLPGDGNTLVRWRALAQVASFDLALVKWFEGHTDALAIQSELNPSRAVSEGLWATWCAEPPQARLQMTRTGNGKTQLSGVKAWCSGAAIATQAVVSTWNVEGEPCLATVDLRQSGITTHTGRWQAVGMAASGSHELHFDNVPAQLLGRPHDYVARPGFWQGGAGIAACWWGGARGIARRTREALRPHASPHALAHLGAIDVALAQGAALLRESARWIDENPQANAMVLALRLRAAMDHVCTEVMQHASRAVGAGPLCNDQYFARAMADLPIFLRQSHAEKDLAALGSQLLTPLRDPEGRSTNQDAAWNL